MIINDADYEDDYLEVKLIEDKESECNYLEIAPSFFQWNKIHLDKEGAIQLRDELTRLINEMK